MSNSCSMETDLAATNALITTVDTVVDANAVIIADLHDTDLPAVKVDTGNLEAERLLRVNPRIVYANINNTSYVDLLNISDKGMLWGISQFMDALNVEVTSSIKIVIDGVTRIDCMFEDVTFPSADMSNSLSFWFTFNTSLQIQHKVSGSGRHVSTLAAYSID